ncbi:coiled-coil domain-containing protein 125 isoform X1 [Octopus bimaculoides]|uniref:Coiled-coil domain-containing protein 125 n=2 Tax=Octopus bimaculoides TaxID=37653 RepID=A0A0L8GX16_OCTBM|nr:coiled-coil domain-containing protein 125 isoform X1 [Octopus bimaculoides]|eukprot:XP_014777431.1 PREDICTED: coiled-coil domain-containing protein 125-like [Octopus bimaculoides]
MTNSEESREHLQEDLVSGDLGLGLGLKPGGFKPNISRGSCSALATNSCCSYEQPVAIMQNYSNRTPPFVQTHTCSLNQENPPHCSVCSRYITSQQVTLTQPHMEHIKSRDSTTQPVTYHESLDAPRPASFQRPSYRIQETLAHLLQGHDLLLPGATQPVNQEPSNSHVKKFRFKPNQEKNYEKKLIFMIQEVEEIKMEFENCQLRLESKYEAIRILKQQMEMSRKESSNLEKKIKSENEELVKAVNSLQFALGLQETTLMDSQQTWAHRFDSACNENAKLLNALEKRSEELQKVLSQKMAITRERDELLALLDIQDKVKYDRIHCNPNDRYSSFTTSEMAVLGACICRGQKSEPCACAYSAANMHREVLRLQQELELSQQQTQDSFMMANAYRYAFEEQLFSFRQMLKQINDLNLKKSSTPVLKHKSQNSSGGKKESVLDLCSSLLKQSLRRDSNSESGNECENFIQEQYPEVAQDLVQNKLKELNIDSLKSPHLITVLLEMLQEKSETLAYQKLASRILANKLKELESGLELSDSPNNKEEYETKELQVPSS